MKNQFKVLLYTESSEYSAMISKVLEESGLAIEVQRFSLLSDVLESLSRSPADSIVTQHDLVSDVPSEILRFLRHKSLDIPYILVTNLISEESAVDLFINGAEDYVLTDRLFRLPLILRKVQEKQRLKEEKHELKDLIVANERWFHAIIEHGAGVVVVINSEKNITYLSPSLQRVLGYNETEVKLLPREQVIYPDDLHVFERHFNRSLESPGMVIGPFEIRVVDKSGNWLWFQASFNNLLHTPEVDGIVFVLQDIHSQKEAEKSNVLTNLALESERGRFHELLSHAPAGMGILNGPDHVFQMVNPFYFDLIGQKDVIGMPLIEAIPYLAEQGFVEIINEVYRTGATQRGDEMMATVYDKETGLPRDIYIDFLFQAYKTLKGEIQGVFFFINDVTEQVLARKVVEESERRYKQIVETAQEGIWLINGDGITTFVNRKLCEILGYEESELLGKHYGTFLARGYSEKEMFKWERSDKQQIDMQFISKMGNSIWTTISSNSMFDDDGKYLGTLAMVSDITDKKKLEELLNKASTMARIGSFEIDMFSNKLFWSDISKEIHEVESDYKCDFPTATNFYKAGLHRDLIQNSFLATYTRGTPLDLEVQIVTAKGNERWVRVIADAEFTNGECSKMFGSIQDIDAQKKVEIELLKTVEEKENILESIGDGFFTVDPQWKVLYWNNRAEVMLNVNRSEILGRDFWEVFPELIDSPFFDRYHLAMSTKTVQQIEAFYEKMDRWYEDTIFPSHTGLSIYFKDVTERKLADIRMHELNEELKDYTRELITSNKELEQFSYIISHNLRAPVANIKGLLEALNDQSNGIELREVLWRSLSSSVQVLDDVINDLNIILKNKKQLNEKKETVNFDELVSKVETSILNLISDEKVVIETNFEHIADFFTLKSYMYSIFYNLISNSIKYRQPDKAPLIRISSTKLKEALILNFSDNGMGIDLDSRGSQVFGLYRRFHNHKSGKGLGLFMVKSQVETLGGSITLESAVNRGTDFTLVFPLNM